jgi:hypothetical protein
VYEEIKPKKGMAALRAAIPVLGFAFVLAQSTAAIKSLLGLVFNSQKCCHFDFEKLSA